MPLEFIDLNSLPVVAAKCDNRKAMGGKRKIAEKGVSKINKQ